MERIDNKKMDEILSPMWWGEPIPTLHTIVCELYERIKELEKEKMNEN